jgi:C-terminal peptidase prc
MLTRFLFLSCLVVLSAAVPAPAARATAPVPDFDDLARRAWGLTDVILDRQVDPCSRQEMLLGGVRGLLRAADREPPPGLSRRVSAVTSPQQLAGLLRDLWPGVEGAAKSRPNDVGNGFVLGLLAAVPGKPQFLPPQVARVAEQIAGNRYVGIGIQIKTNAEEHYPQIVDPFRRGTARKGGAKPDDLIVEVDGRSTKDVPLAKVVDWLRGDEGTSLTMVVRQPKAAETRTLHLTREKVPLDTVFGYRRRSEDAWTYRISPDQPIAYAHVSAINSGTLHELRTLERTLRAEDVRALILDLRHCAGSESGLEPAGLVADGLLSGGLMWRVRDAHGVREVRADPECLFRGWPLAVLVGTDPSAAGPAAVAAALQDNRRAVLIGGRSAAGHPETARQDYPGGPPARERPVSGPFEYETAKGEPPGAPELPVTGLVPLPDWGGALSLRVAAIERARKGSGWPVRPDHVVNLNRKQAEAIRDWLLMKGRSELPPGTTDQLPDDPQLAKAIDVLRETLNKTRDAGKTDAKGK